MGWISGAAVYLILWWTVLFAVLPFGVQPISADEVTKGHAAGAPRRPRMLLKTAVTSVVAAVLWLIVYFVIQSGVISFTDT
ncbi:MAG: DUF1467 family protein [Rhodospirillales bacterium]|nr:DUF1467 family protein [Rhodospirillales bacterium]